MKNYMSNRMNKMRIHRHYFQLLELMVAIFILLVCVMPVIRIFTSMYQSQRAIIREHQRDHLAHLVHAKFTEQLYKRMVPFEEEMEEKRIALSDPDLEEQLYRSSYQCMGILTVENSSKENGKFSGHLCKLIIKMTDVLPQRQSSTQQDDQNPSETVYDYYIYIDRTVEKSSPNSSSPPQTQGNPQTPGAARNQNMQNVPAQVTPVK